MPTTFFQIGPSSGNAAVATVDGAPAAPLGALAIGVLYGLGVDSDGQWKITEDAGVNWFAIADTAASSGWTDDGTVVRLTTATDQVSIGVSAAPANRKLNIRKTGTDTGIRVEDSAAADNIFENFLTNADANPAFRIVGSGTQTWGAGGATAIDTQIGRGAADRLDLGSGDSLDTIAGGFLENRALTADANPRSRLGSALLLGAGGATALDTQLSRVGASQLALDNGAGGAATFFPGADGVGAIGTSATRWSDIVANAHRVFAASGDANASARLASNILQMGPGGATALDVSLTRGAADRWELGSGDSLDTIAGGFLENRAATADVNPRSRLGPALLLGAGGATALDTQLSRVGVSQLSLDNGAGGAATFFPGADAVGAIGTSATRWSTFVSNTYSVFAASGDANPTVKITSSALEMGTNSADALSIKFGVSVSNRLEGGNGDNLGLLGAGVYAIRALSADANPQMQINSASIQIGAGGATAADTRFNRTAAKTISFDDNAGGTADFVPAADNTCNLGTAAKRWALIRGVTITSGAILEEEVFDEEAFSFADRLDTLANDLKQQTVNGIENVRHLPRLVMVAAHTIRDLAARYSALDARLSALEGTSA
jgi:hypothetical protein